MLFGGPVLSGQGPRKPANTRRVGVEARRSTPLASSSGRCGGAATNDATIPPPLPRVAAARGGGAERRRHDPSASVPLLPLPVFITAGEGGDNRDQLGLQALAGAIHTLSGQFSLDDACVRRPSSPAKLDSSVKKHRKINLCGLLWKTDSEYLKAAYLGGTDHKCNLDSVLILADKAGTQNISRNPIWERQDDHLSGCYSPDPRRDGRSALGDELIGGTNR